MMRTKKLLVALSLLLVISWPSFSEARSGCCSHHGGVCGCGCCDGSDLSATCAPYYPECGSSDNSIDSSDRTAVKPAPATVVSRIESAKIKSVDDSKGGLTAMLMLDGTTNLLFKWDNFPNTDGYSTTISDDENSAPDSTIDTDKPESTFKNVKPGKYFISVKGHRADGKWTKSVSWEYDIPVISAESNTLKDNLDSSQNTENYKDDHATVGDVLLRLMFVGLIFTWLFGFPILSFVLWRRKKSLEFELTKLRSKQPIEPLKL